MRKEKVMELEDIVACEVCGILLYKRKCVKWWDDHEENFRYYCSLCKNPNEHYA